MILGAPQIAWIVGVLDELRGARGPARGVDLRRGERARDWLVGNLSPRVHGVGKSAERAPASPSESEQVPRTPDGRCVLPSPRRRLNERTDLTPPAENREPRR